MFLREFLKIIIGEILRVFEGLFLFFECIDDIERVDCLRVEFCVIRKVWEKVKEVIENVVDFVMFQDLVDDYKKMMVDELYMFYI